MPTDKVTAVIPTFDPERTSHLRDIVSQLRESGISVRVTANSRSAFEHSEAAGLAPITSGSNAGFGESVAWAMAEVLEWDWMVILNDDLELSPGAAGRVLDELRTADDAVGIVYLDPEDERPIPGLLSILLNVSLMQRLGPRIQHMTRRSDTYKSFSAVAIRSKCWNDLRGFDPDLPFTYEDSDFARRAKLKGYNHHFASIDGIVHHGSSTTASYIEAVLPVGVWSATAYGRKWSRIPFLVRPAILLALLVRLAAAPFARAPARQHYRGIVRAAYAVVSGNEPRLPSYEMFTK